MKTIKEHVNGYLSERDKLMQAGISPVEALSIVSEPLRHNNIKDVLCSLKISDLDALINYMKCIPYDFKGKLFSIVGMMRENDELIFQFADVELQVETFTLTVAELHEEITQDMLEILKLMK